MDVNNVVLIGRLVRDADLKYTTNGKAVSKVNLAVNERRKVNGEWKDNAGFFELILWGKLAESLHKYLLKGKQIAITGKLNQERWEQNGDPRSKVNVTVMTVQLLGGGSDNSEQGQETFTAEAADIPDETNPDDIPF